MAGASYGRELIVSRSPHVFVAHMTSFLQSLVCPKYGAITLRCRKPLNYGLKGAHNGIVSAVLSELPAFT